MSLSVFEAFRKQKMKKSLFLWLLILSAFYAFVCTPIFHLCSSNILLRDSVYPIVLDFLMSFLNYLFYWIAFSFLIYAFFRFEETHYRSFFAIYAGVVAFRYCANLLSGFLMTEIPLWEKLVSDYLPYLLIDIGLDLAQMGALLLILRTVKYPNTSPIQKKRGILLFSCLPFTKMFNFKNPIQKTAFWGALIPAILQLFSQIIFDISYGAPTTLAAWLWMILYYLLILIYLLVGFFVIVLLLNRFYLNEEKARMEYEQPLPNDPV